MPISLISKSILHFLLSSFPWKLSQLLGHDQQNSKQTYCRLSIIIFLWTPKGFISRESLFNFLLNLYISPWLRKRFRFIVLRLLQIYLWVKKLKLFNFTHAPKQNSSQADENCPFHKNSIFWRYFFLSWKRGRGLCSWKYYGN